MIIYHVDILLNRRIANNISGRIINTVLRSAVGAMKDMGLPFLYYSFIIILHHITSVRKAMTTTMIILQKTQIAKLIEAGCTFQSDVIISKNKTKAEYCSLEVGFSGKQRETKTNKTKNCMWILRNAWWSVPGEELKSMTQMMSR